jgi:hypothetical protein
VVGVDHFRGIFALKDGVCYGIEVKGLKGVQSVAQKQSGEQLEAAGGVYILAMSTDDLERSMNLQ